MHFCFLKNRRRRQLKKADPREHGCGLRCAVLTGLFLSAAPQTRVRSWAVGRAYSFAAPAVYDARSGRYFAALAPPGGTGDPALVTWTDADSMASLDGAVGGGSTRLPDGLAALVPLGDGANTVTTGGGVLAVDGAGSVRWFGSDARKLAVSAPPGDGNKSTGKKKEQQQRRVVETASAMDGGGGVLVVTVNTARGGGGGDGGNGRTATLYCAVGGEHSGRSVEAVWEVAVDVPEAAAVAAGGGAPRVVSAAASGDELVLLWSGGVWAAYAPRGTSPGTPTRSLVLTGAGGVAVAATAAATPSKAGGKKRSARAGADTDTHAGAGADASPHGGLPAAACVPLGGGYYAVAQVGDGCGGGTRVAVVDSLYGGVHAVLETHPGSFGGGAQGGVHVAALREGGASRCGQGGAYRLVVVLSGEVMLSEVPALPPLSLAAALGALNTGDRSVGTGGAAGKVLGGQGVAACSEPPQHGVIEPKFPPHSEVSRAAVAAGRGGSMVDLGGLAAMAWWEGTDGDIKEAAAQATAALLGGDAPVTAAEALGALGPFLAVDATMPPAVLAAAVAGCVRRDQWEPIQGLVAGGHLPSSAAAPELVAALLGGNRLTDLEAFLGTAREVSAADVRRCLDAFLGGEAGRSVAAVEAVATRQRAVAETAVLDAESATAAATAHDARKKHGGTAGATSIHGIIHRARVAAAASENFPSMPWATLLHALVARSLDPATAAKALPGLTAGAAAKLIVYLSTWLAVYSGGGAVSMDLSARPPVGLPSVGAVVSWASAVIDAHFTTFAMSVVAGDEGEGECGAALASLRAAAAKLQAACASVGKVTGALQHMREGGPLPEHQGVLSTTYTIELVDW